MSTAYIALGANIGDRDQSLQNASNRLAILGTITRRSSIYETDPVGYLDQPPFLNAVMALETSIGPTKLLSELHKIEYDLGRERSFRNAPRTIDLDLLLYDDEAIKSESLTIPHPRMHERAFVLIPLGEIAPDLVIPGAEKTVRKLVDALPDDTGVRVWSAF